MLIVDLFAGGGGASQGIFEALGRHPDAAVNHDKTAVLIHEANHPATEHWCNDIWSVDPNWVARGRKVGLLWASPDCTHHSKAKGSAPDRSEQKRDLAMVITSIWVPALKPSVIILENVEEFKDWGPLKDGRPVAAAKGEHFRAFVNSLKKQGYKVEWRELVAADYGAPTTRKRLFLIARCDGKPIVWPEPSHADPARQDLFSFRKKPWRTAAEIIDWSIPCPSIFASSKEIFEQYGVRAIRPLKENTLNRIAKGLQKFVLDHPNPFIINLAHTKKDGSYDCFRGVGMQNPLPTITKTNSFGLITPFVTSYYGPKNGVCDRSKPLTDPLPTQTTENRFSLIAPFLQHVQHSKAVNGVMPADEPLRTITAKPKGGGIALIAPFISKMRGQNTGSPADSPIHTLSAQGKHHALIAPVLSREFGCSVGAGVDQPVPTIMATGAGKTALVSAFLTKYYETGTSKSLSDPLDTITCKDRFFLVTVLIDGHPYAITDIGMRMLAPHELLLAQGFPTSYRIDRIGDQKITKSAQVAMIGNSVCPPIAKAIVAANCAWLAVGSKPKNPAECFEKTI